MKNKYVCGNCGHKHSVKYIRAMIKAGHEIRHIACKGCGQQTIGNK